MSFILLKLIGLVIPLRASVSDESTGLDITQHGEEAYLHTGGATERMHMPHRRRSTCSRCSVQSRATRNGASPGGGAGSAPPLLNHPREAR